MSIVHIRRAELAALRAQEPVAWLYRSITGLQRLHTEQGPMLKADMEAARDFPHAHSCIPLYAATHCTTPEFTGCRRQSGGMTGCAATAQKSALVDPAIQPDALRMAAVDLARQQADEIERLRAERDALQEDLRCVAHSGMGSGLEQKPAAWACIWPDECGGGGFTTLDETAARNYMAGAREYQPGPKLVPLYAAPVHVAPAGWQLVPVEPTVEMLIAGDDSVAHINDSVSTSAIYRAMLASAPKGGE